MYQMYRGYFLEESPITGNVHVYDPAHEHLDEASSWDDARMTVDSWLNAK